MVGPSSMSAPLNAGGPGRSPEGTAMLAGLTGKHIAIAGRLGAARRSARNTTRERRADDSNA
jgi:hypothetical protein